MLPAVLVCALSGCLASAPPRPEPPVTRLGGVTLIRPRCAGVGSCLLGQVVAAETASPMARAAVFLEREEGSTASSTKRDGPVRITVLTDDQGVFTVQDAPRGRYRMAVYKDARSVEVRGLELGEPGTTVVPVRLPPG